MNELVVEMAAKLRLADDQRENLARFVAETERTAGIVSVSTEVEAMSAIAAALEPLDMQSRERVLEWATTRFTFNAHSLIGVTSQFAHILAAKQKELNERESEIERKAAEGVARESLALSPPRLSNDADE